MSPGLQPRRLPAQCLARSATGRWYVQSALDDERLSGGVSLSTAFDHDRSIFRCNRELDVAARFTRVGTDAWWHVLITPHLCGSRGWRSATDVAIHARPRISTLRNAPIAESLPPNRGGLSPARTHRICEYINSNLDQNISPEGYSNDCLPGKYNLWPQRRWVFAPALQQVYEARVPAGLHYRIT
jgi:hypothetical protein